MEAEVLLFIQEYRYEWLTSILKPITHLGDYGFVWIVIAVYLCLKKFFRNIGIKVLAALAYVLLVNNIILKNLVDRARPFEAINGLTLLTAEPSGSSFPSGHTAGAFAAGYIFYRYLPKKYSIFLVGLALLMGISRIYVGAHYLTDVLGGIIIGCICGFLGDITVDKFYRTEKKKL